MKAVGLSVWNVPSGLVGETPPALVRTAYGRLSLDINNVVNAVVADDA